jgi:glycosyltransferase involved in cell wall biosynthesis
MARVRGGLMRVVETVAAMQGRAHTVLVLSPLQPELPVPVAGVAWAALAIRGNLDIGGHRRMVGALDAFKPDAVIIHAGSPGELAVAAALMARRAPTVIVEHLVDYYPLRSQWTDAVLPRLKRLADRWVAVSEASARALETMWRLPVGTVGVLRNGVGAPPVRPPSEDVAAVFSGADVVLGIGEASTRKGLDTFTHLGGALAPSHPEARFVWVGGERLEERGAVTLLPWSESVGWMMRRARMLVVPSRAEGLPLVVLEAWASRLAVVASAVGGVPEVVQDGVSGLLVPPEDRAAWTATVGRLLGDAAACERLAAGGYQTWKASFTAEAMVGRYYNVVEDVVRGRTLSGQRPAPRGGG